MEEYPASRKTMPFVSEVSVSEQLEEEITECMG